MDNIVKRIVLTGGPCAGKSSSLELIEKYLRSRNYIVYTVQESATELINSGIKPFGDNKIDIYEFQNIILKYQIYKENLIESIIQNNNINKTIIVIYDRGIIDSKAYIGKKLFEKLLNKYNLEEIKLLKKYDLVIDLESAAKSIGYTLENNKARIESVDEAIEMDNKIFEAWKLHKNLIKVKCYDIFEDKQHKIIEIIDDFILKNISV